MEKSPLKIVPMDMISSMIAVGLSMGSVMYQAVLMRFAPSMRAASKIS